MRYRFFFFFVIIITFTSKFAWSATFSAGELEITKSPSQGLHQLLQQSSSIPPSFTASPFADEFVTTGAEWGSLGEHYFPSNGDGTFGMKSVIPDLGNVDGTDVADMDNDGDNDFLMCDGTEGEVFLYTNNGSGSFTPTLVASSITNTGYCTNLRIDDFNKDGLLDFVVGDNRNGLGTKVYLQGPVGTFTVSDTLDTSWTNFGNNLFGLATGDINVDGNADILMLGYFGTGAGQMRFYAGDGSGNFAVPILLFNIGTDFGVGSTVGLAVFDLESDGDLDIIAGGGGEGTHFIYTNDGTGNFTKPISFVFDVNAQTGLDAFDADGDGDDDIVVAAFGTRTLHYVENLGGTLAPPVVVDSLDGPSIGVGAPPRVYRFLIVTSIQAIKLGEFFLRQFEAVFGVPPFSWSIVSGTLPSGISLSSDGVLSGTPTELGEFTFTVSVTDSTGDSAEKTFTIKVVAILLPDIRIEKTGTVAVPGRVLDYFILVRNVGDGPATNIQVLEILNPQQFSLISVDPPATTDVSTLADASLILWEIPSLNPGEARIFSYQVRLDPSTPLGSQVIGGPACSASDLIGLWASCVKDAVEAIPKCSLCVGICGACGPLCLPPEIGECPGCLALCGGCTLASSCAVEVFEAALSCFEAVKETADCAESEQTAIGPVDPNEKVVIAERFIQPDQLLVYLIHFENIGAVEARDVFITDVLDPNLDVSTLKILTPNGASFDATTRTVRWDLIGRNLQPGETDNVMFSIKPLPNLPSGTEIRDSAKIQFEIFDPLITPEVVNIIDSTPPTCMMDPLPEQTSTSEFPISWSGTDKVGEIEFYSIFVSVDGKGFKPFLERTKETNTIFSGEVGKTYEFVCIAADTADNVEVQDLVAEAITYITEKTLVTIDIKPGSFPNSINLNSAGVIPVAILTTETFDATTVDPMSVKFGPNGAIEAHGKGHIEDIDENGDADLVLHFNTQESGIECGDTSASLTGETFDGQPIVGSDSINTVECE